MCYWGCFKELLCIDGRDDIMSVICKITLCPCLAKRDIKNVKDWLAEVDAAREQRREDATNEIRNRSALAQMHWNGQSHPLQPMHLVNHQPQPLPQMHYGGSRRSQQSQPSGQHQPRDPYRSDAFQAPSNHQSRSTRSDQTQGHGSHGHHAQGHHHVGQHPRGSSRSSRHSQGHQHPQGHNHHHNNNNGS